MSPGDLSSYDNYRNSTETVLRGRLGRTYSEEVLSRVLYATQLTRRLDAHGEEVRC